MNYQIQSIGSLLAPNSPVSPYSPPSISSRN